MNSLKEKLALSYALLIVIILAVSGWAIYHLVHLGRSVDVILVNNYKSILAAENMKEALERIDSSAMFAVASHIEKAKAQFAENAKRFEDHYRIAADNITEPGEAEIVNEINSRYSEYKKEINDFIISSNQLGASRQSDIYFKGLEPAFLLIKDRLDALLHLNQQAMVLASERAQAESLKAEVSTAIVATLGLALALGFAWRFTTYVVGPISLLTTKAKLIGEGDFDQHIEVSSKDEIGTLAYEFNRMLVRLRDLRKSDYGRLLIEQKKSDAVIDSICEPVIVTDSRDNVIKINRAARNMFTTSRTAPTELVELGELAGSEPIIRAVHDAVSMQRPVAAEDDKALVPISIDARNETFECDRHQCAITKAG